MKDTIESTFPSPGERDTQVHVTCHLLIPSVQLWGARVEVVWCAISDLDGAFVNCGGKRLKCVRLGGLLFCLMLSNSPDAAEGLRVPLLLVLMKGCLVCCGRSQIISILSRNSVVLSLTRQRQRDDELNWTMWIRWPGTLDLGEHKALWWTPVCSVL